MRKKRNNSKGNKMVGSLTLTRIALLIPTTVKTQKTNFRKEVGLYS